MIIKKETPVSNLMTLQNGNNCTRFNRSVVESTEHEIISNYNFVSQV